MCMQATGWPAIFFAAKNGRVSILKKLLERGAMTELEVVIPNRHYSYHD